MEITMKSWNYGCSVNVDLKENNIKTSSGLPTTDFIYLILSSIIWSQIYSIFVNQKHILLVSRDTQVSSTNKTDRHDKIEILLRVALDIITLTITLLVLKKSAIKAILYFTPTVNNINKVRFSVFAQKCCVYTNN